MKTNLQTNEAPLSSVMTPMLAWQDVYTRNRGRASDVSWEERDEKRGRQGGRDVMASAGCRQLFWFWQEDSCNSIPLRAGRARQRNGPGEREAYLEKIEKHRPPPTPAPELNHNLQAGEKQLNPLTSPLSRSVDYKWANLAFITSLQTFIKAGSPPKLQR